MVVYGRTIREEKETKRSEIEKLPDRVWGRASNLVLRGNSPPRK
jgi:hypothetical protein